jgi:hypothetical protein
VARSKIFIAIGLVGSVGLSACGGSSGLARKDLVARANAICAKSEADLKAVPPVTKPGDTKQLTAYFDKAAPIGTSETNALAALKPASDVKADFDAFIAKQRAANDVLQTLRAMADAKDPGEVAALGVLTGVSNNVSVTARVLGATGCA